MANTEVHYLQMTKEVILAEALKLSPAEQYELVDDLTARIGDQADDCELTEAGKAMLDERWKEMRKHPERNLTLDELKARVQAHIRR